jgi:hypothetical protein
MKDQPFIIKYEILKVQEGMEEPVFSIRDQVYTSVLKEVVQFNSE